MARSPDGLQYPEAGESPVEDLARQMDAQEKGREDPPPAKEQGAARG